MGRHILKLLIDDKFQLLVVILLPLVLYLNTLPNQYVWDDKTFINWGLTRSFKNIPLFFKGALPGTHTGDYRPFKGIILTLNYKLWGTEALGYRIQAIAIHLTAILLVYATIKLITGKILSWLQCPGFYLEFTTVPENPLLLFGLYPLFSAIVKKIRKRRRV